MLNSRRKCSSAANRFMASANTAESAGSTRRPFLPSTTLPPGKVVLGESFSIISGLAPTVVAITGSLADMASSRAQGKPSLTDGKTKISNARRYLKASGIRPARKILFSNSRFLILDSIQLPGKSPTSWQQFLAGHSSTAYT